MVDLKLPVLVSVSSQAVASLMDCPGLLCEARNDVYKLAVKLVCMMILDEYLLLVF